MASVESLRAAVRAMGVARAGLYAADQRLSMAMNAKAPAVTQELLDAKTSAGLTYTAAVDLVLAEERNLGIADDATAAEEELVRVESHQAERDLPFGREA